MAYSEEGVGAFCEFSFKNNKVRGEQRLLTENLYRVQARLATWASLATRPFKGRVFFHETFYFFICSCKMRLSPV